jgi:hypothetical protein
MDGRHHKMLGHELTFPDLPYARLSNFSERVLPKCLNPLNQSYSALNWSKNNMQNSIISICTKGGKF